MPERLLNPAAFEPLVTADMQPVDRAPASSVRALLNQRARAFFDRHVRNPWRDPERHPKMAARLRVAMVVLSVGLGVGAYFTFRAVPQPDYLKDGLDDVFNYTLLTDEFNNLPLARRLELVGQLVSRLKNMDSGDSALMAAFAAGISGAARDQLMKNASKLAIDVWDSFAVQYDQVPASNREQFLDNSYIEFTKMMETLAGSPVHETDSDRLAEGRREAQRGRDMMKDGRGPDAEGLRRMFNFMTKNVGGNATPQQRARGAALMRDMASRMRGERVSRGKP